MVSVTLASLDYARCPSCGADATSWVRGSREAQRIAFRRRDCAACGIRYNVVIATLTDNPLLAEALSWYAEAAQTIEPREVAA